MWTLELCTGQTPVPTQKQVRLGGILQRMWCSAWRRLATENLQTSSRCFGPYFQGAWYPYPLGHH